MSVVKSVVVGASLVLVGAIGGFAMALLRPRTYLPGSPEGPSAAIRSQGRPPLAKS